MPVLHHSAICVQDVDASLRFWRDGLGFDIVMDGTFAGDWPHLLGAPSTSLRAVFLGHADSPDTGIVELVDLGPVPEAQAGNDHSDSIGGTAPARSGFLLLSLMTDVDAALARLAALDLGGEPRRVEVSGLSMAVVRDPDGVLVELVDDRASANLGRMAARTARAPRAASAARTHRAARVPR